jgi:hypothetical protein
VTPSIPLIHANVKTLRRQRIFKMLYIDMSGFFRMRGRFFLGSGTVTEDGTLAFITNKTHSCGVCFSFSGYLQIVAVEFCLQSLDM